MVNVTIVKFIQEERSPLAVVFTVKGLPISPSEKIIIWEGHTAFYNGMDVEKKAHISHFI